jgi:hypothetical protein
MTTDKLLSRRHAAAVYLAGHAVRLEDILGLGPMES